MLDKASSGVASCIPFSPIFRMIVREVYPQRTGIPGKAFFTELSIFSNEI